MERTCFNCVKSRMCYLKHGLEKLTKYAPFNIDGEVAPGKHGDLHKAMAGMCIEFKPLTNDQ